MHALELGSLIWREVRVGIIKYNHVSTFYSFCLNKCESTYWWHVTIADSDDFSPVSKASVHCMFLVR